MRSSFIQTPQVLVVEASAGSGKTYALAKRYVQLSLALSAEQSVPIQSILAITFTNKATWAMKSRILDFFKRIVLKQLKPYEIKDILGPLGLNEDEASSMAFNLMNDVIRQYHYFQVQTIDSFVNILLVGCSFKIGLSARFKIQRNSSEYLQLSLDELLEEATSNKEVLALFEDFVRQYLFLENRSGWFPQDDLLKVIGELFRQYNTYQKSLLVYPSKEDAFTRKKKIMGLIRQLRDLCPLETSKRFVDHLDGLLASEGKLFDVDDLAANFAREDFPINKGGQVSQELLSVWRKVTYEIHELCLWEAFSMFNPYVALFDKVINCFALLSKRDDVLFLEELNRKASLLFEDGLVTVEELYFRLAARFRHYLMDEFQDTSVSQWCNLSLMVEEALSHGGSLFYVGDKKQAIYAFRGGDSRLFEALQVKLSGFNVQSTSLNNNYRSCPEIIKFNNRIFSIDNLEGFLQRRLEDSRANRRGDIHFSETDFEAIKNTFAHAHQSPGNDKSGGLVRVVPLQGRVKQDRAVEVRQGLVSLLIELRGRFALKDIAILTRGNQELEEIAQWLLEEGIYASSERNSDIKTNTLVAQLISLLTFLRSPVDNNAFAQFCLGDLIVKATGVESQVFQDFLFECAKVSKQKKEVYFYKEFQNIFPEIWKVYFEDILSQAGVYPLYELTAGILKRFSCENHFAQYQGFMMHFLEMIKRQEKESCDLSSFLDYFEHLEGEDRFVPMAQLDAVKILTVHKAKGLEFPVVIVPFLEMDIKAGSGGRDGSQSYILDIQEERMSLIRLKESYRQFCPEIQIRYEQEYKKAFLVELNNIYVALTRAIEEMYIFVPSRVGNSVNPAKFLIPEDCMQAGVPHAHPAMDHQNVPLKKIKPFISDSWGFLQEEFLHEPAKSASQARRGEFYHAVLMHLGHIHEGNIDQELENAFISASRQFLPLGGEVSKQVIDSIRQFINRQDVRRFFYLPNVAQVFCEKEFVNRYGDVKRIDRLIVYQEEVWIVDYKLSQGVQDAHQKQMDEYIELIRHFYPKYKISGHVLYLASAKN